MIDENILKMSQKYINLEKNEYFRNQIEKLIEENNEKELNERFYKDLDFGTGGMRGEIGGGFNRMNTYVVKKATQGLANYIKKAYGENGSCVIAYDSRNFSDTFAMDAALVLAGNGVKTYLFSELRPTPELSFAVRNLKASAGIVVTASHNPKEYNGYKVYWSDGGQVVPPHDKGIISEVRSVTDIFSMDKDEAIKTNKLSIIDKEVDDAFIEVVKNTAIRPELLKEKGKDIKVVYTPLHGTGGMPISRALGEMGVDVTFVEEQKKPDGNFPTAESPNPEEASALKMAIELGKKVKADLVMATDPDADRFGIAVPYKGDYVLVTGNQLGALIGDYIFGSLKSEKKLPDNPLLIKTIVTSELQRKIADKYGAVCVDVLTGFKYIGEKILEYEKTPHSPNFVFGGEESYGYLVHTHARDKDAVSVATMVVEMTLYYVSQGKSLMDRLEELWKEHGYYEELLISKHFKGQEGAEIMTKLMDKLRKTPPLNIAGKKVKKIKDYISKKVIDPDGMKEIGDIELPVSNVLQFILEDDTIITARPSGTEPKIKFYGSCHSAKGMELSDARKDVSKKVNDIKNDVNIIIESV